MILSGVSLSIRSMAGEDAKEQGEAGSLPTPESSTVGEENASKGKGKEEQQHGKKANEDDGAPIRSADYDSDVGDGDSDNDSELNGVLEKDSDTSSVRSWASRSAFGFTPDPADDSRWVRMSEVKKNVYDEFSNARMLDRLFVDIKRKAREVTKKAVSKTQEGKSSPALCIPEIKRMEWDDFKPVHRRFAIGQSNRVPLPPLPGAPIPPPPQPSRPLYVIEVLVDEPWRVKRAANAQAVLNDVISQELSGAMSPDDREEDTVGPLPTTIPGPGGSNLGTSRPSRSRPTSLYMMGTKMARDPSTAEYASRSVRQVPARVRIRSRFLLALLREICNGNWGAEVNDMVFFRPFKLFSKYKHAILEEYQKLVDDHPGFDPEAAVRQIQSSDTSANRAQFVFLPKRSKGQETEEDEAKEKDTKDEGSKIEGTNNEQNKPEDASEKDTNEDPPVQKGDDGEITGYELKVMENSPVKAEQNINLFLDVYVLKQLLDEDLKPMFEVREKIQNFTLKSIVFDDLWHLYDYGQEVLVPEGEEVSVYRVLKFTGGRDPKPGGSLSYPSPPHKEGVSLDRQDAFNVQCWRLSFDGKNYVPVQKTIEIRRYDNTREITSLPVYPIRFDAHHWQNRQKLVQQGRAFERYATGDGKGSIHQTYQGPNLEEESKGQQIDSEVIIDFQEAFNHNDFWLPRQINPEAHSIGHDLRELHEHNMENADCSGPIGCVCTTNHTDYRQDTDEFNEFLRDNKHVIAAKTELSGDEDAILLPKEVYGFVLKDRSWAVLSTAPERLHDLEAADPWEDLVISPEVRSTVEALVERHVDRDRKAARSGKANFGDFIRGKVSKISHSTGPIS